MYNVQCACKKTNKSFSKKIGEFFINKCCEDLGYDIYGNPPADLEVSNEETNSQVVEITKESEIMVENPDNQMETKESSEGLSKLKSFFSAKPKARKPMRDMSLKELKNFAKSLNVTNYKSIATKKPLIDKIKEQTGIDD